VNFKDLRTFGFNDDDAEGSKSWSVPFPFDVAPFPVDITTLESTDTSGLLESGNRDPIIPAHLPSFPPAYTYKRMGSKKRSHEATLTKSSGEVITHENKEKRVAVAKTARQSLAKLEDAVDNVD
jgi:hypothetical protein